MIAIETIKSFNPATGKLLGETPCFNEGEVKAAVDRSWKAYEAWRITDYHTRAKLILQLRRVIAKQADEIAQLITEETGKPLVESLMAELLGPLDACIWFAENTERALKDQIINLTNPLLSSKQSVVTFESIGVVGIISPWNYPFAIPVMSMIMALMVGNTVVLKPSEKSSLVGIKIADLFNTAGFPEGVVTVITGDCSTGAALTQCPLAKLLFTGSVDGGKKVVAQAAENIIPVALELGGKDPAIVLSDAPPVWTAQALVWGAFTNCGQACASIERLYIVKGKHTDQLVEQIIKCTKQLRIGNGLDPSVDVGPLIDKVQLEKVKTQVESAFAQGAKILCGGKAHPELGGHFFEPTVLVDVNHSMSIMKEETFGPVLPIMIVDSEDEALELANWGGFGLSASVWSKRLPEAEDLARDLEVGTVFINDCLFSFACPQVPWGGLKKSGHGRTHSYFGLIDLVNIKHISIDSSGGAHRLWWYPYDTSRVELARGGLKFLHGNSLTAKISGAFAFLKNSLFTANKKTQTRQ